MDELSTAGPVDSHPETHTPDADELSSALLFGAHHVATKSAQQAVEQCGKATQGLQQCRSQFEACADQARRLEVRLRDARGSATQLGDALERIKLVALNTGLEGARLGESSGKALVAIAEEVRNLSARGLDVVATHVRLLDEAETEQSKLVQAAELAQTLAMDLAALLRQTQECQFDALASLDMLEKAIERASGLDANAALEVQRVAEHGQGLLSALQGLSVSRRQKIARTLLLPTVEPLLRALLQTAQADGGSESEP
jgi:type I site-specific restriction endonuclease